MATLLTNGRMDPALVARIEASVAGRRGRPAQARWRPRSVSLIRVGAIAAALALVASIGVTVRRARREIEVERSALLERVTREGASLTADDAGFVGRAAGWMARLSGGYEGDFVADELRASGGLAAALARPAVYVRGPAGGTGSPHAVAETAAGSMKDPLLLCLMDPPATRAEKALLAKVRVAYAGGVPVETKTANVRRLHDAEAGLPVLLPPWAARVREAKDLADLAGMRQELERAPIADAKRAVRAEVLLVAVDEPGDGKGPTELDGERPHDVRVALVDLRAERVLLRMRRHVDPSGISAGARPQYAAGIDSCGLGFDLRAAP